MLLQITHGCSPSMHQIIPVNCHKLLVLDYIRRRTVEFSNSNATSDNTAAGIMTTVYCKRRVCIHTCNNISSFKVRGGCHIFTIVTGDFPLYRTRYCTVIQRIQENMICIMWVYCSYECSCKCVNMRNFKNSTISTFGCRYSQYIRIYKDGLKSKLTNKR